ncbi:hypothetical protein Hanom_Chr03g00209731 [Helianthus anomalus]
MFRISSFYGKSGRVSSVFGRSQQSKLSYLSNSTIIQSMELNIKLLSHNKVSTKYKFL